MSPRIALLSIVAFWLFYFAIITVRSVLVGFEDQIGMLPRRALVVLVCMAATVCMYLALRRIAAASLSRSMITVGILAIPAAIVYSSINFYAFADFDAKAMKAHERRLVVKQTRTAPLPPPAPVPPPSMPGGVVPPPPAPAEPPAPTSETVTVQIGGAMHDDKEKMTVFMAIGDQAANGYFFFVAWAALYLALGYAAEAVAAERRAAGFRAAAQAAELRALRYQVNPHFLFNTLNSLSSLVLTGRAEEAERMIMNLSTFFRTSLTGDPTEDVPLYEEIRLQRLYLDIETVRFPERLVVDIQIPDDLRTACVPGLILQPLIENAIKYGVSRTRRPVTLRVRAREEAERLVLTVEDDGDPTAWIPYTAIDAVTVDPASPPKEDAQPLGGTGVGLKNVRDRLIARFGAAGRCEWGPIEAGGFCVKLSMPLHRNGC